MSKQEVIEGLRERIGSIESVSCQPEHVAVDAEPGRRMSDAEGGLPDADGAFKKLVALANVRDRSEKATRERLAAAGFEPRAIDAAIARALSYGFIDDMRYAAVYVRSQLARGKGIRGIEQELRRQDIELESVPGWPEEFDFDEEGELDRALEVLERKPPQAKNVREGAFRRLVAKGYSTSVASTASRIWFDKNHR